MSPPGWKCLLGYTGGADRCPESAAVLQDEAVQSNCLTLKSPGGLEKAAGVDFEGPPHRARGVSPALAVTVVPGLFSSRQSPPAVP